MDTVTRTITYVRWRTQPPIKRIVIRLPPYLRMSLGLLLAMIGMVVGALMMRPNVQTVNPFAAYAEIFPGQPFRAVIGQGGFSCDALRESCTSYPNDGVFSMVSVTLKAKIVRWIVFTIRENKLTVGDLTLLWGRPDIRLYGRSANFDWGRLSVSATGSSRGFFTYYIPVTHIVISGMNY